MQPCVCLVLPQRLQPQPGRYLLARSGTRWRTGFPSTTVQSVVWMYFLKSNFSRQRLIEVNRTGRFQSGPTRMANDYDDGGDDGEGGDDGGDDGDGDDDGGDDGDGDDDGDDDHHFCHMQI